MSGQPRRRPTKHVRVRLALQLTEDEAARLEARAAGEVRSVGNYIARVIELHLASKSKKARKPRDADPDEQREAYEIGALLSIPERRELEKRAAAERRSVSSYVTRLLVDVI